MQFSTFELLGAKKSLSVDIYIYIYIRIVSKQKIEEPTFLLSFRHNKNVNRKFSHFTCGANHTACENLSTAPVR